MSSLVRFVRDSNRIESITRDPTSEEIAAHEDLLAKETLTVKDIEQFVSSVQPDAKLRRRKGQNVVIAKSCSRCDGSGIGAARIVAGVPVLGRCRACKGSRCEVVYRAPEGGREIESRLAELLTGICNSVNGHSSISPWEAHLEYETLHPFTDGNGRSGRAIWAWQMRREGRDPFALPVLQKLYFDALDWGRGRL